MAKEPKHEGLFKMSSRAKVAEFISFCIEMFAKAKNISGDKVAALFESRGIIGYLDSGYDMLHTQDEGWLLAELDEILKSEGVHA